MSHLENFDNFKIETNDIWICERSYFFDNEEKYGVAFASNILDKLQVIISQNCTPNFGLEMKESDSSYYYRKYDDYVKSQKKITERFALEYFFNGNNCFSFISPMEITPKNNDDYLFWFTLKLRQYDLNLSKISEFLSYQQKENFKKNISKFIERLKNALKQYPELLSERVIETTNNWINNYSEKGILKNGIIKTKFKSNTSNKNNGIKTEPVFDNLIWQEKNPILKATQLKYLRDELQGSFFIDKISSKLFEEHFSGVLNLEQHINWKKDPFPLIYFLDKLNFYLDSKAFGPKTKTISIKTISAHFWWKDKEINLDYWYKVKSEGADNTQNLYRSIDKIISNIPQKN